VQNDDVTALPSVPTALQLVPGSPYAYPAATSAASNAVLSVYEDTGATNGFTQFNGIVVPLVLHVPPPDPVAVVVELDPHSTVVPTDTVTVPENDVPFEYAHVPELLVVQITEQFVALLLGGGGGGGEW